MPEKYAERKHNWSVCKKGYLSVTTANEVAWDSPTWFGGGSDKMKKGNIGGCVVMPRILRISSRRQMLR